jgi:Leucine-rich repeat (LRR) protein
MDENGPKQSPQTVKNRLMRSINQITVEISEKPTFAGISANQKPEFFPIGETSPMHVPPFFPRQLESLPAGFHELRALRCLYLQSNRLRTLPGNIGELTNLEVLFAADNIITSLPDSLAYDMMTRPLLPV